MKNNRNLRCRIQSVYWEGWIRSWSGGGHAENPWLTRKDRLGQASSRTWHAWPKLKSVRSSRQSHDYLGRPENCFCDPGRQFKSKREIHSLIQDAGRLERRVMRIIDIGVFRVHFGGDSLDRVWGIRFEHGIRKIPNKSGRIRFFVFL